MSNTKKYSTKELYPKLGLSAHNVLKRKCGKKDIVLYKREDGQTEIIQSDVFKLITLFRSTLIGDSLIQLNKFAEEFKVECRTVTPPIATSTPIVVNQGTPLVDSVVEPSPTKAVQPIKRVEPSPPVALNESEWPSHVRETIAAKHVRAMAGVGDVFMGLASPVEMLMYKGEEPITKEVEPSSTKESIEVQVGKAYEHLIPTKEVEPSPTKEVEPSPTKVVEPSSTKVVEPSSTKVSFFDVVFKAVEFHFLNPLETLFKRRGFHFLIALVAITVQARHGAALDLKYGSKEELWSVVFGCVFEITPLILTVNKSDEDYITWFAVLAVFVNLAYFGFHQSIIDGDYFAACVQLLISIALPFSIRSYSELYTKDLKIVD